MFDLGLDGDLLAGNRGRPELCVRLPSSALLLSSLCYLSYWQQGFPVPGGLFGGSPPNRLALIQVISVSWLALLSLLPSESSNASQRPQGAPRGQRGLVTLHRSEFLGRSRGETLCALIGSVVPTPPWLPCRLCDFYCSCLH